MLLKVKQLLTAEVLKYILIGVITQLLDLGTYSILVSLGIYYILADIINVPLVLGFNYLAHKYITFDSKKWSNKEVGRYILNVLFNYAYATVILVITSNIFGFNPILGKTLQIIAVPLINYFILKKFVFKKYGFLVTEEK